MKRVVIVRKVLVTASALAMGFSLVVGGTAAHAAASKNLIACQVLSLRTNYATDYATIGLWIQKKKTSDQAGKAMQNIGVDFDTVSKLATPPLSTYFAKESEAFHALFNDFVKKDGKAWTADSQVMVKYRDLAFAICAKTKK
jgi:hypothetical protein